MSGRHDKAYKALFTHPGYIRQLMESFAPRAISDCLDYSTLKNHSGHYITPLFEEKIEDLVWSMQLKSEDGAVATVYVCLLLEFQSSQDASMPLRMLHYVASFYHQLIKQEKLKLGRDKLPLVFPFVLYNGEASWKVPCDMRSLIHAPPKSLAAFQPQLRYYLVDEKRLADQQLDADAAPLSGVFAIEKAEDSERLMRAINALLQKVQQHPDRDQIEKPLVDWVKQFMHHHSVNIDVDAIHQLEELPTMLDLNRERQQWKHEGVLLGRQEGIEEGIEKGIQKGIQKGMKKGIQKGVQQGRQEGVKDTAKRMLEQGIFTDKQITMATGLSLEQVEAIKREL